MLTAFKQKSAPSPASRDTAGMIAAIFRVMAVIEFSPEGSFLMANPNFSAAVGCDLSEIQGRHHRMFAEPAYAGSEDYRRFWERLNRGEYVAGEFKRSPTAIAKSGCKPATIRSSTLPVESFAS